MELRAPVYTKSLGKLVCEVEERNEVVPRRGVNISMHIYIYIFFFMFL